MAANALEDSFLPQSEKCGNKRVKAANSKVFFCLTQLNSIEAYEMP